MAEEIKTPAAEENKTPAKPKRSKPKTAVQKLTNLQQVIFRAEFPSGVQVIQHERKGNMFITRRVEKATGDISYTCFNYGRKVKVRKGNQTVMQWSNMPHSERYAFEVVGDLDAEKELFAAHIIKKYGSRTPNA